MPGSPAHLIRRFFDVASARPLSVVEVEAVAGWLADPLQEIFFEQSAEDQRHGYHAALTTISLGFDEPEVIVAALCHDVAKRHARLGLIGRSMASVAILAGVPLTDRMMAYRDHGLVGARELAAAGAPGLAVDFALHHHGARPASIPSDVWEALVEADQPPKTLTVGPASITSRQV